MASYPAKIVWERGGGDFAHGRYSRAHVWSFDGGAVVTASASPHVVPLPWSDPNGVDPEEAFVASLASCHMLWFLSIAAKAGFTVERYEDDADGILAKNAEGRLAMTIVTLRPSVVFSGAENPDRARIEALHHAAHEACFIASSVKTEVRCEPRA